MPVTQNVGSDWWLYSLQQTGYLTKVNAKSITVCPDAMVNKRNADGLPLGGDPAKTTYTRIGHSAKYYPLWNGGTYTYEGTAGFFPYKWLTKFSYQFVGGESNVFASETGLDCLTSNSAYFTYNNKDKYGYFHPSKRMNCLFADWHVKSLNTDEMLQDMMDDPTPTKY